MFFPLLGFRQSSCPLAVKPPIISVTVFEPPWPRDELLEPNGLKETHMYPLASFFCLFSLVALLSSQAGSRPKPKKKEKEKESNSLTAGIN